MKQGVRFTGAEGSNTLEGRPVGQGSWFGEGTKVGGHSQGKSALEQAFLSELEKRERESLEREQEMEMERIRNEQSLSSLARSLMGG